MRLEVLKIVLMVLGFWDVVLLWGSVVPPSSGLQQSKQEGTVL
jgi:hypothetical protein